MFIIFVGFDFIISLYNDDFFNNGVFAIRCHFGVFVFDVLLIGQCVVKLEFKRSRFRGLSGQDDRDGFDGVRRDEIMGELQRNDCLLVSFDLD